MAQMVASELRFIAARIACERCGHDARTVDEHVQRSAAGHEARSEGVDRVRREQVMRSIVTPDSPASAAVALSGVLAGTTTLAPRGGEHARGLSPMPE